MARLGEDVTEVLDYIPGRFRVIRHVRPKYACRRCDAITQAPAPSMPTPRGRASPGMLAHLLVSKYCDHLPLYRQSEIYARDGLDLDRSTLSDWVGQAVWLLQPIDDGIRNHVFAAEKVHADDTPVPVREPGLGRTRTGRVDMYDGTVFLLRHGTQGAHPRRLSAARVPRRFQRPGPAVGGAEKAPTVPGGCLRHSSRPVQNLSHDGSSGLLQPRRSMGGPKGTYGGESLPMEPYYILMKLPGSDELQYLLMTPCTPQNRDNMISWMAAKCDFPEYAKMLFYQLPKEKLIYGPNQIEAVIDQNTTISQQLALWDQKGSRVIRGKLMVTPIEDSFLYVVPVYLTAEGTNFPQLKRVIAVAGDKVVMEPTLDEAINNLFGVQQSLEGSSGPPTRQPALEQARTQLEEARKAMQQGDWAKFGTAMEGLEHQLAGAAPR